ncbi:conserved hypothetical protein [Gloeothece citriformis PCC 7424]|uniref:Uncharacterized protein n=1 Tax=Gloeothece citriformis (strain PCC 7424) TaxID=65393 RepID=B7KBP2_GLOC7|nr:hypothetical protein [Gloeothece citriformis]ACK73020.1 conserved hypothetical protein [Gloeothece citriformis PCC 7424]
MVYLSEQSKKHNLDMEIPILLDPTLLRAARRIYRTYCSLHSKVNQRPFGVAIDRETYRGQLIFKAKPILLPRECFVPLKQLESEIY